MNFSKLYLNLRKLGTRLIADAALGGGRRYQPAGDRGKIIGPRINSKWIEWGYTVILFGCLVQFSSAWLWGAASETSMFVQDWNDLRPFGLQFKALLWVSITLGFFFHIQRRGFDALMKVLLPFAPFVIAGTLASALGIAPFSSFRAMAFWGIAAVSAAMIGDELNPEWAIRKLIIMLYVLMAGSLIAVFLFPENAMQLYEAEMIWRGLFSDKNNFGWISVISFVLAFATLSRCGWILSGTLVVISLACLVGSGSKGALVAGAAAIGYILIVRGIISKLAYSFAVGLQIFLLVALAGLGVFVLPMIVDALGRDLTLTGRTEIWSIYLGKMMETPWLGQGPGAFTDASEVTNQLLNKLSHIGLIYTPHNMYLGAFGDSGFIGLMVFVGTLIYASFAAPLRYVQPLGYASGALGFLIIAGGTVETRQVYSSGIAMFILILIRAMALRAQADSTVSEE